MRRRLFRAVCAIIPLGAPVAATAQGAEPPSVTLMVAAASLTAPDVERAAAFYETVFGFSEIRRIDARPEFLEIVLKPGVDAKQARAATGAALILISRPTAAVADFPNLHGWARARVALVVPEMAPVLARTKQQGGSVVVEATKAGGSLQSEVEVHPSATGSHIDAMIEDPAGNFVELLAPR